MFGFGRRKEKSEPAVAGQKREEGCSPPQAASCQTRHNLTDGLGDLLLGKKVIDADLLEELEELLILADVGMEATGRIIEDLTGRLKRKELSNPETLLQILKQQLRDILDKAEKPVRQAQAGRPQVILMVGVNGAGKTTTIGKLAKRLQQEGQSVMLAAGDTFAQQPWSSSKLGRTQPDFGDFPAFRRRCGFGNL